MNLIGVIADWSATVMDYLFEVPAPLNVEINVREDMPKDAMHVHSGDGDGIEAPLEHDPDETDFYGKILLAFKILDKFVLVYILQVEYTL